MGYRSLDSLVRSTEYAKLVRPLRAPASSTPINMPSLPILESQFSLYESTNER